MDTPSDFTPPVPPETPVASPPATPSDGRPDGPPALPRSVTDATRSQWARRSVTLKLFAVGALTLVLLVPLLLLRGLISERERLRDTTKQELAVKWGGPQRLGGPVLTIPLTRPPATAGTTAATDLPQAVHILPDDLTVTGTLAPEVRRRGLHRVVLYTTRLNVKARFPQPTFDGLDLRGGVPDLSRAYVELGIPDMAGVKEPVAVRWNGAAREASPGIPSDEMFGSGVHAPVALTADSAQTFETTLALGGAETLRFLPFGKTTTVTLSGPWAKASATGSFLADTIHVGPSGFNATWTVLHLNRNYGQRIAGRFAGAGAVSERMDGYTYDAPGIESDGTFGIQLLDGVDGYRKTMRMAEYGLLFVLLTFGTFFFVEVLGGRRVHPVQYLLVGLAVSLFYLMLLALSEFIAFDAAYAVSAVAILSLVLLYTKAVFHSWRTAGTIAGILAGFYVYFYVLLNLEDLALLVGTLGLFVILAVVMYLSRRVDWYGMTTQPSPETE